MKNNQPIRLIRLPEVLQRTGYGKAWLYRLISEGRFPAPVKIGVRAVAFVESEIDEWIDEFKISCSVNKRKKMNISDFEQYEGYWEIIDENLFDEVFYIDRIEKLEPTKKVIKAIELLSFYLLTTEWKYWKKFVK